MQTVFPEHISFLSQHTGILSLFTVCFFCAVTDFIAAEKDRGMKFCMRVWVLSGQVFSYVDELWLAWSHGGGITSGMYASTHWSHATAPGEARWAVGIGCFGAVGQSELGRRRCL